MNARVQLGLSRSGTIRVVQWPSTQSTLWARLFPSGHRHAIHAAARHSLQLASPCPRWSSASNSQHRPRGLASVQQRPCHHPRTAIMCTCMRSGLFPYLPNHLYSLVAFGHPSKFNPFRSPTGSCMDDCSNHWMWGREWPKRFGRQDGPSGIKSAQAAPASHWALQESQDKGGCKAGAVASFLWGWRSTNTHGRLSHTRWTRSCLP